MMDGMDEELHRVTRLVPNNADIIAISFIHENRSEPIMQPKINVNIPRKHADCQENRNDAFSSDTEYRARLSMDDQV